jgi:DNA-binding NtrC family response regulator
MRYPQVLIYESDRRLYWLLKNAIEANQWKWSLRELRRTASCWSLLRRGGPNVVVLHVQRPLVQNLETLEELKVAYPKLGTQLRYLTRQMTLLQQIRWLMPETAVVVVGATEDRTLADLAWDLGADYVLFPPQPREQLVDIVAGLMKPASAHERAAVDR